MRGFSYLPLWSVFLATAAALLCCAGAAPAQQGRTIFCLADGTTIGAERFETRDGKFFLYVPGSATPLEYPASAVRGIDAPGCGAGGGAAQVSRFGVHGSNTIG